MSTPPIPYNRQASFMGFSTEQHPAIGQDLEAEFGAIRQCLEQTQDRLAQILRDDGMLCNLSIHPDSLGEAARAPLGADAGVPRGNWQTGRVYHVKDVVMFNGVSYLAAEEHATGTDFNADLAVGRWMPISAASDDGSLRTDLAASTPGAGGDLVGFNDRSAPAYLKTVSDVLNGVPVNLLRNIPKSRWAGIQDGTDTDDCADSIMALMDGASNARVARITVPAGRFTIHKPIQRLAGSNPFRLVGDDWQRSIIVRGSDWAPSVGTGSVFNVTGVDGHAIENLRIIGNATLHPTNANHAIACSNSNNVTYRHLYVEDWKNSGILVFHYPGVPAPDVAMEINNVIDQCYLVGNNFSNNGILLVDQENSYISRCVVLNLGQTGTPQSALQFKNNCFRCHITDSIAVNARHGVAFGQEDVEGMAAEQCSVSNVLIKGCVWGLYMGKAGNSIVNGLNIDMGGVGSHPIEMIDCTGNAITNVKVFNQRTTGGAGAPYTVKMTNACTGNLVEFSEVKIDSTTAPRLAWLSATSTKNTVMVKHLNAVTTPLAYTGQVVNNENTAATAGNVVQVNGYPGQESLAIAAGAIVVRDASVSIVRVNTEASAPTDDLDTITGPGIDGQTITLKTTANSRDVTVKHGTGNIRLAGGADFTLALVNSKITLQWDAVVSFWCEVSRSNNA